MEETKSKCFEIYSSLFGKTNMLPHLLSRPSSWKPNKAALHFASLFHEPVPCGSLELSRQANLPSHRASERLPVPSPPHKLQKQVSHSSFSGRSESVRSSSVLGSEVCTWSSPLNLTGQEAAPGFILTVEPLSVLLAELLHYYASRNTVWLPLPRIHFCLQRGFTS